MIIAGGIRMKNPAELNEFVAEARKSIPAARAADGNLSFICMVDDADAGDAFMFERWRDESALQAYLARPSAMLGHYPKIKSLFLRLLRVLHELWLSEYAWQSIEVFAPIYDLICEMMALHGLVFARHEAEWRLVMTGDEEAIPEIQDALAKFMARPGRLTADG